MDLVVGALSGMVDALPGKLGALLEQEYALLSGVRSDVVFLQRELGSMRAAIRHCESLDQPDTQTAAWIGRVRELAYDTEDWVDLFAIRVDSGASAGATSSGFFGLIHRGMDKLRTLPARHVVANELKDLKDRAVELSQQRNRYSCVLPLPEAARPTDPRLAALFIEPSSLVGLDGPLEELSKIVMDAGGGTELKIVSIVGMAGAGKTTLANVFYRSPEAQNCFQCRAFVPVGQKVDMVKALKDILSQLGDRHRGGQDISQLIDNIRNLLKDKRYLIVVDDLWSRERWGTIRCCFPENNHGSRIITTTRNNALLTDSYSVSNKFVHKIDHLSDADAKKLFLKKSLGNELPCPQHLEDVFSKIISRCCGLPLAIVSIAAKLAHRQSRDEWEKLGLTSLCSTDGSDGLKQILNLSYQDLSPHLRTCLLYLSIFPENFEVGTERLVRRWIAEGFITEASGGSAEDIAISYLNELISRNLVEPLDLNLDGIPRRCRVHPVVHDFIIWKSMEDNFATLMDAQQQHVPNNITVRRLSLKNSSKQDQPVARNESTDLSHARSITVFGHASAAPHLTDLKVVRVLDLEGCKGPVCLDGLCKLVLLRYLSLKGTDASELPATIGELRCLETIDVSSTKVKELPTSINRLGKLIHLLAGSAILPMGIAKMKALQTLSCATETTKGHAVVEEFSKHDNLRELELYYDAPEVPGNVKQIMFPDDGFHTVKRLCIRCSSPSVTFEPGVLPKLQVLELRFEKGRADKLSGVCGIEHLSSLRNVLLEFKQNDVGAMVTVDAVENAAQGGLPGHQNVTIKVDVGGATNTVQSIM